MFTPLDLTGILLARGNSSPESKEVTVVAGIQQRTMAAIITLEGNEHHHPEGPRGQDARRHPELGGAQPVPDLRQAGRRRRDARSPGVDGEPADLIGLLAAGTAPASASSSWASPPWSRSAKGKKAVVLPYSDVMTDLYGNVLVTSNKIAKENPEMVKRFTAALIKGLVYSIDNPKEAGEILKKNVPTAAAAPAAAECELMAAFVRSDGFGCRGRHDRHRTGSPAASRSCRVPVRSRRV